MKIPGKDKREKDKSETLVIDKEDEATAAAVLEEETAPLGAEMAGTADSTLVVDEPAAVAIAPEAPEPEGDPSPEAGGELPDDLMDIFTSEVEEDVELSAMTEGLEEFSMEALLSEARDIAVRVREAANP